MMPRARKASSFARSLAPRYRWPLQAVMAPERGIAQVRNMLVAEALHDAMPASSP